jgi:protein-tyrosine phosphatase
VSEHRYRIAFVCLGNICRSPMAEVVARDRLADAGLADRVAVFSRGTGNYHDGEDAHGRTLEVLRAHGHRPQHVAAQITPDELASTDLVLALDRANERDLRSLARSDGERSRIRLLLSFDPAAGDELEVPDPWGKPLAAFEQVYALVTAATDGLVYWLRTDGLPARESAGRP